MRLDIYHHVVLPPADEGLSKLIKELMTMTGTLQEEVQALVAETADSKGKLNSIATYIRGVPALTAAAVAAALEAAGVGATQAAELVATARQEISDSVDDALAAVETNDDEGGEDTQPGGEDTTTAPEPGEDTQVGGGEDDF